MGIDHLNTEDLIPLQKDPLPGARSFFAGDHLGGAGWVVPMPDGTQERHYVQLPESIDLKIEWYFENPPTTHLDETIRDTTAQGLTQLYYTYLADLVDRAVTQFGGAQ